MSIAVWTPMDKFKEALIRKSLHGFWETMVCANCKHNKIAHDERTNRCLFGPSIWKAGTLHHPEIELAVKNWERDLGIFQPTTGLSPEFPASSSGDDD